MSSSEYYHIKWIKFLRRNTPILLQNKNGPSPLLAAANLLLLRNELQLDTSYQKISTRQLLSEVVNYMEQGLKSLDAASRREATSFVDEVTDLLPTLTTPMEFNCSFNNPDHFESVPEMTFFDLLDIKLVHAWLPSPDEQAGIGSLSSFELFDELIRLNRLREDVKDIEDEID
eukprot:Platyproteum_vivax@DN9416_c0_g1_i1.p1